MTVVGSSLTSSGVVWGSDGVGLFVAVAGFGDGVGLFVVVFGLGVGVETSENIKKLCKTLIQT